MTDEVAAVSSEPVIAPLPTPISVEPRTAAPAEATEIARQAEEAKLPKSDKAATVEPKVEEKAKPLSTREALRAAREKIEAPAGTEKASPLKAAEPVAAAKAAEPTKVETQPRAEDGKFTAKADASVKAEPVTGKAADAVVAKEAAKPSFTAEPPPARFANAAKEKWAEAPEEVRAEVTRAVTELTKGYEKHRIAAERDAELAPFHEMAGKNQQQLKDVVAGYVDMENTLRNETTREKGFETLFQKLGISPREWAAKIMGATPEAVASKADAATIELRSRLEKTEQALADLRAESTQSKTDSTTEAVTKFASDPAHSRFDELSDDIAFFLKTKYPGDLAKAYDAAERLNPAPVKAAPAAEAAPASSAPAATVAPIAALVAQPDKGTKSIAGAPTAGSDPARKQPSLSVKEAIRAATRRAG